jgi:hypothetical protein
MMPSPDRTSAVPSPRNFGGLALAQGQDSPEHYAQENQRNLQFVELLNAFRRSGGLARAPEVAARFHAYGGNDVSPLAGWINKRQVICFEWQTKRWMPLFQFNPVGLSLRAGLNHVLDELLVVCDDWELAIWFAQPNPWLADRTPTDMLAVAAPQVLNAARAERFEMTG